MWLIIYRHINKKVITIILNVMVDKYIKVTLELIFITFYKGYWFLFFYILYLI